MESEIQFFMSEQDQQEFLTFTRPLVDSVRVETLTENNAESEDIHILHIGDCQIKYRPSPREGNILYAGKITINTGTLDDHCAGEEQAKSVYRKIKNWVKKHYWSRLAYININKRNKLTPSRSYWVGPDAKRWKDENPSQHIFKLSTTSWMVFEIGV